MNMELIRKSGRSAFTLIELMVVVSIIALLVALTLPALGKAKAKGVQTVCLTRVRNLNTAMHLYLNDWDMTYPVNGLIMPKASVPTMYTSIPRFNDARVFMSSAGDPFDDSERWRPEYGALWPYLGGNQIDRPGGTLPNTAPTAALPPMSGQMAKNYLCPADAPEYTRLGNTNTNPGDSVLTLQPVNGAPGAPVNVTIGPNRGGYWSYSVNSVLNSLGRFRNRFNANQLPWSDPIKFVNIKAQSRFITFIEEDNASLFNDEVFDAPAYSQGDLLTNRHLGKGTVGHADGTVEAYDAVIFNQVPSGITGQFVDHAQAMTSPITRDFFPDQGEFVAQ